jgi:hypothetical protein
LWRGETEESKRAIPGKVNEPRLNPEHHKGRKESNGIRQLCAHTKRESREERERENTKPIHAALALKVNLNG